MLRHKDLCPTPPVCPYVREEDPLAGEDALPCAECPAMLLKEHLQSPAGRLVSAVIDLDFALQAGITVTMSQISYPVFLLLRQLADERTQLEKETLEKRKDDGR